jgi:hypothetical protein
LSISSRSGKSCIVSSGWPSLSMSLLAHEPLSLLLQVLLRVPRVTSRVMGLPLEDGPSGDGENSCSVLVRSSSSSSSLSSSLSSWSTPNAATHTSCRDRWRAREGAGDTRRRRDVAVPQRGPAPPLSSRVEELGVFVSSTERASSLAATASLG